MLKILGLALVVLAIQACSSGVKSTEPNVTSTPSGAVVYSGQQKLGITPLRVDLPEAFPARWGNGFTFQASGLLIMKRAGCEDYTLRVSDAIISKPIHAKLKCDKNYVAPAQSPMHMPAASPARKMNKKNMSKIEKRLSELKGLFKKGVITQDEYNATRKRILKEL